MHNPPLLAQQPLHHEDACNPETGSNILFLLFPSVERASSKASIAKKKKKKKNKKKEEKEERKKDTWAVYSKISRRFFTELPLHRTSLIPWWPIVDVLLSRNSRATTRVWRATRDTHQKRLHQRLLVAWLRATLLSIRPVDSHHPSPLTPSFPPFFHAAEFSGLDDLARKTSWSIQQSHRSNPLFFLFFFSFFLLFFEGTSGNVLLRDYLAI